ncbi:CobW family GTP-binding protein [Actinoplanes utahensis]|uniref:Cobalamin biosynthesis protein CobW n=1 Tax=Actinoplanes utahensis TaxID=1869 RepID=A0A0A6UQX2_ACTUT|nr:GTP-binding protein [Actinoplanes utahensis]KHD77801.1 cobalamin biosynthesis protein CobW [Actinoplanes utahensis]GIF32540.1 cobalamin synthesis protein P47K [Actinoplanes utahensis]
MSANPITSAVRPPVDHRPAVTVLSGFSPGAVQAAARALLIADEELLAIRHDLTGIRHGLITRTVESAAAVLEHTAVELVHGCVSCTLREDVLPTVVRLARERPGSDLLLVLPPAVEPEAVAAACSHCLIDGVPVTETVRFDSYVTVVDADCFLDDLASPDDLSDRDLHAADDDHRAVAEVVVHQVEFSDTVILWSRPDTDALELSRLGTLVHRLAPWSIQVSVGTSTHLDCTGLADMVRGTGRHDPARPGMLGLALEGRPIAVHDPDGGHGVTSLVFRSRRPFHPQRLHDALEDLTEQLLRGRGQLWIASQPDTALAFEFAGGGVSLGTLGYWLAALPLERWTETSDERRLAADLDWDPYYGDRRTVLALIGLHLDHEAITGLLTACLLTDAELADGFDSWRALPDPFAGCFPLTGDTTTEEK